MLLQTRERSLGRSGRHERKHVERRTRIPLLQVRKITQVTKEQASQILDVHSLSLDCTILTTTQCWTDWRSTTQSHTSCHSNNSKKTNSSSSIESERMATKSDKPKTKPWRTTIQVRHPGLFYMYSKIYSLD